MNIHEHQAKDLIKKFGAPVSKGVVIFNLNEIDEKIAKCMWLKPKYMLVEEERLEV